VQLDWPGGALYEMESPEVWEQIGRLGGGGQSEVFLARCPTRVAERARCLQTIRTAIDGDKRAELAEAIVTYARPENPIELGAMKKFKIREDGGEEQALHRLQQELHVLQEQRPGLPKLLDSNQSGRWIVTEYFPRKTVEDNISLYKGNAALALKAFLSLVDTVKLLHAEDIVHRDIKPANVFVKQDDQLVLGDFGIVYLPDRPARLTRTNESVGPHDYMPPWGEVEGRLDSVDDKFDVYMLGKLLWCMVSGRLLLQREWFRRPQNDVTRVFPHDPHMHMINTILEKCVVENPEDCVSISDVRAMVIAFVSTIEHGGQLLQKEVPRPCHVCGHGQYQPERLQDNNSDGMIRIWTGGSDTVRLSVQTFTCDSCGHVQFFKTAPR
jgi:serine/threonine protein kinase